MGQRAFKNHHGYLTADGDHLKGSHELTHHGKFHVEYYGDKIAIRTHHGKYIAADHHHKVYLAHHPDEKDALFHLERHGSHVAIKGHHGKYIGLDSHGHVRTHHEVHHDEKFEEIIV